MARSLLAALALAASASPALAGSNYFDAFVKHWSSTFQNQNSIVMLAIGVGAVGVFIITRNKWKK